MAQEGTAGMADWRDAVRVMRGADLQQAMGGPDTPGRGTLFDFAGTGGGNKTWVGRVVQAPASDPGGDTGPHRHGRHEVMIHVLRGHAEIRWGARLEFAARVGPGDSVYFAPQVPHAERNLSADAPVEYLVVRSDGERIVEPLAISPVAEPERVG